MSGGYVIRHNGRKWVAVFEFDAEENEAIAYAFGHRDGAYDEHLRAAEELREHALDAEEAP